jgi:antitoxin component YwqK of YwqJK toxin-antitoxin module
MSNNIAEGEATEWYPSGKKFRTTPFTGGKPHGTVTVWSEDGKILSEQQYENGNLLQKEEN